MKRGGRKGVGNNQEMVPASALNPATYICILSGVVIVVVAVVVVGYQRIKAGLAAVCESLRLIETERPH